MAHRGKPGQCLSGGEKRHFQSGGRCRCACRRRWAEAHPTELRSRPV